MQAAAAVVALAVVGGAGHSAELRVDAELRRDFYPMRYELGHPRGGFVLVYPLVNVARLPAGRHAYYPRTGVLCNVVAPPTARCTRVSRTLRERVAALRLT